MAVFGFIGAPGHGKSAASEHLRSLSSGRVCDLEYSDLLIELVNDWLSELELQDDHLETANWLIDRLPPHMHRHTGQKIDVAQLRIDPSNQESLELHQPLIRFVDGLSAGKHQSRLTRENKAQNRLILQWIAERPGRLVNPNVWGQVMDRRLSEVAKDSDLVTVGGIRHHAETDPVYNHGGIVVRVSRPDTEAIHDLAEQRISTLPYDAEIINNGTLEELATAVDNLMRDYRSGGIKAWSGNPTAYYARH